MKVIHLSFDKSIKMPMVPRQPYGSELSVAGSDFEERLPNRVSFSPTVMQSFLAVYPNISQYFEDKEFSFPYMDMYAYGVDMDRGVYETIPERDMLANVWDYHITKEVAFTKPVYAKLIGKIRFYNPNRGKNIGEVHTHPFNNAYKKSVFVGYRVNYDVVKQYDMSYDLKKGSNDEARR